VHSSLTTACVTFVALVVIVGTGALFAIERRWRNDLTAGLDSG
jgi:hypothetical protein